ncbi:nitrate- and nitrite sensing domain-containing protein [Streptomyces sp. NPDC020965]|uniref:sensor histidine kinase n=1 Tax=Streptomyces sp. NPDC020965 TaxID=3365105 RepID=UPI003793D412
MQKKRPQAPLVPETFQAQGTPPVPAPRGRAKRVRSRLVIGVAVVSLIVVGAGAPGVLSASAELSESQRLVTLAELNRQAVTLAHSLSDERDEVTTYIAAGRDEQEGEKADRREITPARSARVDRQIDEIRGSVPDDRADLRRDLSTVPSVRRTALTGKGTAMEAHRAYSAIITTLHALADELAEKTPPRAPDGARAPADLGLAAEQASATRGLLLATLAVPGGEKAEETIDEITGLPVEEGESEAEKAAEEVRNALSAAAQQSRVRELAALADFDQAADREARHSLSATVTGAEVKAAESYLARLTDRPELSERELRSNRQKLETSLTARIEQMRGVESSLASERITAMEELRDDDVTALELRIALLGGLVVLTIGVSAGIARTLTRPLAVLRIGATRIAAAPEVEEPIGFTGRNDEFAQVVRSLNSLHGKLRELGVRAERLDADRTGLASSRDALAAQLGAVRAELRENTGELTAELQRLRHTVDHTFVNLALRSLGLVERQLSVIEHLEEREQDPERLATLFKLDHMATVMRRHSENLLVLAGAEHGHGHPGAVPLVDVLRAAVSEIERYERVVIQSLPPRVQVAGFAADDLSHLVAELLENATAFSPPDAQVELSGWLLENGEVMLSVQDNGIGMTAGRLAELNTRLEDPEEYEIPSGSRDAEGLGLRVAALLAARHGVRVQLREQKQGGIAAVVVLPQGLLPKDPPAGHDSVGGAGDSSSTSTLQLPGSVAEANSNALPTTPRQPLTAAPAVPADAGPVSRAAAQTTPYEITHPADPSAAPYADPLVEAAEAAVRAAEPDAHERTADGHPEHGDPERTAAGPGTPAPAESRAGSAAESPARTVDEPGAGIDEPTFEMRLPEPPPEPTSPETAPAPAPEPTRAPAPAPPTEPAAPPVAPGAGSHQPDRRTHEPDRRTDGTGMSAPRGESGRPAPARAPEPVPDTVSEPERGPLAGPAPAWDRVTDKGLPKRTPKVVKPAAAPGERSGSVDADALRRRLGGFQRAADQGRREAEAEIGRTATEDSGDTVEEARS